MSKVVIDIEDFNKKLNLAKDRIGLMFSNALKSQLEVGLLDPTGDTNLTGRGIHKGDLKRSIRHSFDDKGVNIQMLDYGLSLEKGDRPQNIDFDELKDWVKQKIYNDKPVSDFVLTRTTKNVEKSIKANGVRPFRFITHTINTQLNDIIVHSLKKSFK